MGECHPSRGKKKQREERGEKIIEFFQQAAKLHRNSASLANAQSKVFLQLSVSGGFRHQQVTSEWFYCHEINQELT